MMTCDQSTSPVRASIGKFGAPRCRPGSGGENQGSSRNVHPASIIHRTLERLYASKPLPACVLGPARSTTPARAWWLEFWNFSGAWKLDFGIFYHTSAHHSRSTQHHRQGPEISNTVHLGKPSTFNRHRLTPAAIGEHRLAPSSVKSSMPSPLPALDS